ncbi:MAG: AAA family ATPase, partial [Clostridia bacterium]
MGKVILVSSGKGGTGKTMFSVNLGAVLAQREKRVILIDLDMGLRNMDIYLGMENKVVYNIMDVVSGICRIKKAMIKVDGFDTLYFMAASPRRDDRDITPLHMEVLCSKLRRYFD